MKAAERMRPILEAFLQQKEDEGSKNMKFGKKRRRRTCFTHEAQKLLNDHFLKNPKPTPDEIQMIANELGFDLSTVKVWFCNRKQNLKRQGQPIPDNSLKSELEARRKQPDGNETVEAHFQNALTVPASQVKHILSASPPTGNVTNLPFILSQDGNVTIVTSPNSLQGAHILPQFIASSSSQQLVLSQVPFVQTVSAMNQGMSGVVTVPTVQPVQVLAARQLPAQVLYQVSHCKIFLSLAIWITMIISASIFSHQNHDQGQTSLENISVIYQLRKLSVCETLFINVSKFNQRSLQSVFLAAMLPIRHRNVSARKHCDSCKKELLREYMRFF